MKKRTYLNIAIAIGVFIVFNFIRDFDFNYFFSKKENFSKTEIKGLLKNNLKYGEWKSFFETGEIYEIKNYLNDTLNGIHNIYEKNGKLKLSEKYRKGIKIDTFKLYSNGELNLIEFRDSLGELQGEFRIYENGKISQIGNKKNGEFHGKFEFYDTKTGKLVELSEYKNGEKSGKWVYLNNKGDTIRKIEY